MRGQGFANKIKGTATTSSSNTSSPVPNNDWLNCDEHHPKLSKLPEANQYDSITQKVSISKLPQQIAKRNPKSNKCIKHPTWTWAEGERNYSENKPTHPKLLTPLSGAITSSI